MMEVRDQKSEVRKRESENGSQRSDIKTTDWEFEISYSPRKPRKKLRAINYDPSAMSYYSL